MIKLKNENTGVLELRRNSEGEMGLYITNEDISFPLIKITSEGTFNICHYKNDDAILINSMGLKLNACKNARIIENEAQCYSINMGISWDGRERMDRDKMCTQLNCKNPAEFKCELYKGGSFFLCMECYWNFDFSAGDVIKVLFNRRSIAWHINVGA